MSEICKKVGKIGYENITVNGLKQLEGGDICCECDSDNKVVWLFVRVTYLDALLLFTEENLINEIESEKGFEGD